jgi:hypothetical protein
LKAQSVRRTSRRVPQNFAKDDDADGEDVDEDEDENQEGEDSELPHKTAGESEDVGDDGVSDAGSADGDDEEDEDEDDDEDDDGYDPSIVQSTDLFWTGDCRFLGFNALASGASKYVSAEPTPPSMTYGKVAMY